MQMLAAAEAGFGFWDWLMIGLYFGVLLVVAWWVIMQRQRSSEDYFLAGRHMGWFVIGASIFASNIGSEHLVGLAGSGASNGMAMAHYELHAWCILVLGWLFVPFYTRCGVFTMPEFLERRYSPASRWFLSLVSLIAYVFTKISVSLYAGGVVFAALFPDNLIAGVDNFWLGAVGVVVVTGLYTVLGGLRAVVYTDAIQAVVLIIGSAVVTIMGLYKLGGWGELHRICLESQAGNDFFNLWKPHNHPSFPWTGILFGAPIVGLWYWCTDQYIVQRTLAARDETQARRGCIFASYLKITPVFLFIVPGMIAFAMQQKGMLGLEKSDMAFPTLVKELLPAGFRGLVVGGLLAALMSSLSSVFNSASTLFTVDIYEKLRPKSSEQHLVTVGRIATAVMVILGILWIPFMKYVSDALYVYLQKVQAYLAPPIFAVFFLGLFMKRVNATGAITALVVGFFIGMARLAAEIFRDSLTGYPLLARFADINFLHLCLMMTGFCIVLLIVVSLLTAKPSAEQLQGMTYSTLTAEDKRKSRASWTKLDMVHTVIVLSIILAVYIYFTG